MTTQMNWKRYLNAARNWANTNFPHFTKQVSSDYTLDHFLDGMQVVLEPVLMVRGKEVDAVTELDGIRAIKVHAGRMLPKVEDEKIVLLLHEMIEAYGGDSCLHRAVMGIRPEHEYAEFVEQHYRQENRLPRCQFALTEVEFQVMQRMDEFYRTFPIWRRYLGDVLYDIIKKDPSVKVTERLRDKVLEGCIYS